jgi:hypothetical protein
MFWNKTRTVCRRTNFHAADTTQTFITQVTQNLHWGET